MAGLMTQAGSAWILSLAIAGFSGHPARGAESHWTQRAREVAAARLAAPAPADASARSAAAPAPVASRRGFELAGIRLAADGEEEPAPAATSQPTSREASRPIARGPLPGLFDTISRDAKEMPGLLWHDTKKVYGNPWNLVFLIGAGGASVAVRPEVDDDIEDHYDKHHTFGQDERDTLDWVGNPGTHFAVTGAMYLAGQAMQDIKTYEVGKRAISALIITDLTTVLLKLAANTEAPNDLDYAWPSGHMSSTMAMATVLHNAYGPLVGVPMFGVAALEGIQRLDAREHHFSDVLFGAALGWVVAETVMKEHRPEIFGGELVPYVDPSAGSAGVAWVKPLGN